VTLPLAEAVSFARERSADLSALDDALSALEKLDARKSKAIELRYFGGLGVEEVAPTLHASPVRVRCDLKMAETRLHHEMQSGLEELQHRGHWP
jgi:RNA polymerase sigma-70 factor, ECF subfamily